MKNNASKNLDTIKNTTVLSKTHKFIDKEADGFMLFLGKYSIISLAIGTVIGATIKDVVNVLVTGIISPILSLIVSLLVPSNNIKDWFIEINDTKLLFGEFINALIQMLLIMLIIYIVIGKILKQKDIIGVSQKKDDKKTKTKEKKK